jgi:hypothetical protein
MRSEVMFQQQQDSNPHTTLVDIKNLNSFFSKLDFAPFSTNAATSPPSSNATAATTPPASTLPKSSRSASLPLKVHQLYSKHNTVGHHPDSFSRPGMEIKSWTESSISDHYKHITKSVTSSGGGQPIVRIPAGALRSAASITLRSSNPPNKHFSLSERDISSLMFVSGTVNGLDLGPVSSAVLPTLMSSNLSSPLSTEVSAQSTASAIKSFDHNPLLPAVAPQPSELLLDALDLNNNEVVESSSSEHHSLENTFDNRRREPAENTTPAANPVILLNDVNLCADEVFSFEQPPVASATVNDASSQSQRETGTTATGGNSDMDSAVALAMHKSDTNSSLTSNGSSQSTESGDVTLTAHGNDDSSHSLNEMATAATQDLASDLVDSNCTNNSTAQEDRTINASSVEDTSSR